MSDRSKPSVAQHTRSPETLRQKFARLRREGRLGLAVRGQIGNLVSAVGERVGSQPLIFNRLTFSMFHRGALETAPAAVEGLLALYPQLRTAVDLGCGTGVYLHQLQNRSLEVFGYEHSAHARAAARRLYGLPVQPFDLNDFPGVERACDLCLCIEVAHYLPPALGDRLVQHCARCAPLVMFSSAQPGQHGYGHINAQPPQYWINRFHQLGFCLHESRTDQLRQFIRQNIRRGFWLANNLCLLERAT
ncbi:MAG: class I SAM-dependent methyltransferase [Phycisphaeraceae bacterium]|nr:class I SAM-dependent methyltransferase [Phycisphaeraceae bacterium]